MARCRPEPHPSRPCPARSRVFWRPRCGPAQTDGHATSKTTLQGSLLTSVESLLLAAGGVTDVAATGRIPPISGRHLSPRASYAATPGAACGIAAAETVGNRKQNEVPSPGWLVTTTV